MGRSGWQSHQNACERRACCFVMGTHRKHDSRHFKAPQDSEVQSFPLD